MTTTHPNRTDAPSRRHDGEREARQLAEAARQTEWARPSFAKELYLGHFRLDLIHPHRWLSDAEQAMTDAFLAESARAVCDRARRQRHRT